MYMHVCVRVYIYIRGGCKSQKSCLSTVCVDMDKGCCKLKVIMVMGESTMNKAS